MRTYFRRICLYPFLLIFALDASAFAQSDADAPAVWRMFEIESTAPAAKWEAGSSVAISVDAAPLIEGAVRPGHVLEVPVPEGGVASYTVLRTASWLPGTHSVTARRQGGSGEYLALSHQDGKTVARIRSLAEDRLLEIRTDPAALEARLDHVDPASLDRLECGVDHAHEEDFLLMPRLGKHPGESVFEVPHHSQALTAALDDEVTIDVMFVYTAKARTWAEQNIGSIELAISQMMNLSQLALDNSDVGIELRVVHAHALNYDEASVSDSATHLRRLTASPDFNPFGDQYNGFMNEVHTLRNQHGADLVAMLAEISDTGGLAWRLANFGGVPQLGFSINRIQQLSFTYTLIHEIGHNIGKAHGRNQGTAAAGVFGGIFPYSTGWRWEGTDGNMYASVMTYAEGSREAPIFSSPDLIHEGNPAGAYQGTFAPADNRRSLREIKRVVASYRPTRLDPPVLSLDPTTIHVTMPSGAQGSTSFSIVNQGTSDLRYDIDFARPPSPKALGAKPQSESLSAVAPEGSLAMQAPGVLTAASGDGTIYETTFSQNEGFATGTHLVRALWRGWSDNHSFEISSANPSTGNQHLRLSRVTGLEDAVLRVFSPYFGPHPLGAYRFSADLSIDKTGQGNYFIYFYDSRTLNVAAGFAFSGDGHVFVIDTIQDGQISFVYAGTSWVPDQYRNIAAEFSPDDGTIRYYYGGAFLIDKPMEFGTSIGRMIVIHPNTDSVIDMDRVRLEAMHTGFSWVDVDRFAGSVSAAQPVQIGLSFDAEGLAEGDYDGLITVTTNDPDAPVSSIPVRLTVAGGVSTGDDGLPTGYRLAQNFPNPFNPSTRIEFNLPEAQQVNLEVFSVTGRKVATLVDGFLPGGTHSHTFDASPLAGGVYFYRLTAGEFTGVRRMVLLK